MRKRAKTVNEKWDNLVGQAMKSTTPYLEPVHSHTKDQAFQSVLEALFQGKFAEWGQKVEAFGKKKGGK